MCSAHTSVSLKLNSNDDGYEDDDGGKAHTHTYCYITDSISLSNITIYGMQSQFMWMTPTSPLIRFVQANLSYTLIWLVDRNVNILCDNFSIHIYTHTFSIIWIIELLFSLSTIKFNRKECVQTTDKFSDNRGNMMLLWMRILIFSPLFSYFFFFWWNAKLKYEDEVEFVS